MCSMCNQTHAYPLSFDESARLDFYTKEVLDLIVSYFKFLLRLLSLTLIYAMSISHYFFCSKLSCFSFAKRYVLINVRL